MEFFNKFRDTIFLKEYSDIELQIQELKQIRENLRDKKEIDRDIKSLEIGLQGEKKIEYELKNANIGMYVLHDITLSHSDLTSQIDYVIVTKAYCYLVECKNLFGDITVNDKGEFTKQYVYNGNIIKESMFSPYTQAVRHKELLKKIWLSKNNAFIIKLSEKYFDNLYKPLVVLANSKSILNLQYATKEVKEHTIRLDQLLDYIKNDIKNFDHDLYSSRKSMLDLANSFVKLDHKTNNIIVEKYKLLQQKEKNLEEELKQYRKDKAYKLNIPAYYIFTDEEMDKLIFIKPKNLEELKQYNILPDVKLKLHGKEIIDILNKKN